MNEIVFGQTGPRNGTEIVEWVNRQDAWLQRFLAGEASVIRIEAGTTVPQVAGFFTTAFEFLCRRDPRVALAHQLDLAMRGPVGEVLGDAFTAPGSPEQQDETAKRRLRAHKAACTKHGCPVCLFEHITHDNERAAT